MSSEFPPPFDHATRTDALRLIELGLIEDVGSQDLSRAVDCTTDSLFAESVQATAALVSRESGIVCGVQVCQLAMEQFTNNLKLHIEVPSRVRESPDTDPLNPGFSDRLDGFQSDPA